MREEGTQGEHQEEKSRLRTHLLGLRGEMAAAERAQASAAIRSTLLSLPEMRHLRRAFVFISHGTEVETHGLMDALLERGVHLSVPKVLDPRRMVAVPFPGWAALVPGTMGIPTTPSSDPDPEPPEVVITPGVGFTPAGDRLGYGRGYYDRWFQAHPAPSRIALAFECQLLDRLPVGAGDLPVDLIVTQERVIRTERRTLGER